jgi:hypothetical protein
MVPRNGPRGHNHEGEKMNKKQKNIMIKGAKWATTLEMEANYYEYLTPNFYVRVNHIELGKERCFSDFGHFSSEKKNVQQNINNVLKSILNFYKERGIKLSVSNLRKIILSLETLKDVKE